MFLWDRLYWQTKREILADIVAQVFSPLDIDDTIMITAITSKKQGKRFAINTSHSAFVQKTTVLSS